MQRFATLEDIDASHPTIEEREEYEAPVEMGMVMYAGVDYEAILRQAEEEADVIIWDGGNNDFPFFRPDLFIVVVDPLRPGHELRYHPGETNLRMADVVVINKVDTAEAPVEQVIANIEAVNPRATIILAASPSKLDDGPDRRRRVLVVDDGPTLTHGGMPFGAGHGRGATGRRGEARRPAAVRGRLDQGDPREVAAADDVLPAMGYGDEQLRSSRRRSTPPTATWSSRDTDRPRPADRRRGTRSATCGTSSRRSERRRSPRCWSRSSPRSARSSRRVNERTQGPPRAAPAPLYVLLPRRIGRARMPPSAPLASFNEKRRRRASVDGRHDGCG